MLGNHDRKAILNRLQEIQLNLKNLRASDANSIELYKEAAILFKKIGKDAQAQSCQSQVVKRCPGWVIPASALNLANMPAELLMIITSGLDMYTKLLLGQTCKSLRVKFMGESSFWTDFDMGSRTQLMTNKIFTRLWKLNKGFCKTLSLENARLLTDSFHQEITLPKGLTKFTLSKNHKIKATGLKKFFGRPGLTKSLRVVKFNQCQIEDEIVSRLLYYMENLEHLDISNCPALTNNAFQFKIGGNLVHKEIGLKQLLARTANITNEGVKNLANIGRNSIRKIDFYGCTKLNSLMLFDLALFTNLEAVDFTGISVTPLGGGLTAGVTEFAKGCTKLKSFTWRSCPDLTPACLVALAQYCLSLETLDVQMCANVTTDGIIQMNGLKNLNVTQCPRLTADPLIAYIQSNRNLQFLYMSSNIWVNDGIAEAISQASSLLWIGLQACPKLSNSGLDHLMKKPKIYMLNIRDNGHLGTGYINALTKKFGKSVATAKTVPQIFSRTVPMAEWRVLKDDYFIRSLFTDDSFCIKVTNFRHSWELSQTKEQIQAEITRQIPHFSYSPMEKILFFLDKFLQTKNTSFSIDNDKLNLSTFGFLDRNRRVKIAWQFILKETLLDVKEFVMSLIELAHVRAMKIRDLQADATKKEERIEFITCLLNLHGIPLPEFPQNSIAANTTDTKAVNQINEVLKEASAMKHFFYVEDTNPAVVPTTAALPMIVEPAVQEVNLQPAESVKLEPSISETKVFEEIDPVPSLLGQKRQLSPEKETQYATKVAKVDVARNVLKVKEKKAKRKFG